MADNAIPEKVHVLPYYSWLESFERIVVSELTAELGETDVEMPTDSGSRQEAEGILLHTLAPVEVDGAGAGTSMRSSKLPAAVADVAAQHRSATDLLEQVFVSIFPSDMTAVVVYVTPRANDWDGDPDLLDLFSVAVLSGRPNYSGRRVLFEGGVLLEDLVAGSPQELRKVHAGLNKRVDGYLWRGVDGGNPLS